jgi:hypothetical protein
MNHCPRTANCPAGCRSFRSVLFIVALYVLGVLHCAFFNWGDVAPTAYDWPKETGYLDVQRHALETGELPWHIRAPSTAATASSPCPKQTSCPTLLLPWLDNRTFRSSMSSSSTPRGPRLPVDTGSLPSRRGAVRVPGAAHQLQRLRRRHLSVGHSVGRLLLPAFLRSLLLEWAEQGPSFALACSPCACSP